MNRQKATGRTAAHLILFLAMAGSLAGAGAAPAAQYCQCDIYVYSYERWMSPWWGLECNEHCGHGYVGSSCDSLHGAGCGAMTGTVKVRYSNGNTLRNVDCPDDHSTCFRGPSACDDGGSWSNTCSADTLHCVPGGNGDGEFDCNGLTDTGWIYQTAVTGIFPGACGSNWFNVLETINEHDPFCCDDPMGQLNASRYTAPGVSTVYLYPSAQNCNGGSQGGVYPHCGLFGATLVVDTICSDFNAFNAAAASGGEADKSASAAYLQALAGSVNRRERQMATTSRESVTAEVKQRARALGVTAPVEVLTDLLVRAGHAELDRDRCLVEKGEATTACRTVTRTLDQLGAEFQGLARGLTLQEFRTGASLLGQEPPPALPAR